MRELKQDWRDIFLTFRIARDPRKVLLGAAGVILSLVWLYFLAWFFHSVIHAIGKEASRSMRGDALNFLTNPPIGLQAFNDLCTIHLRPRAYIFLTILGLGLLAIWSYFGGAISRIAAVELAKDERIEMREARKFACRKYWAYLWAPLVPAIGVCILGLCNFLGGLFGCIPVAGDFAMGVFFPLSLLAGFLIALITIGGVAGYGLMVPAISAEGTDAFDGISRAYSYIYSKPWRFVFYCLLALGYAVLCVGFIYLFTNFTVGASFTTGKVGLKAIYGKHKFDDILAFYSGWQFAPEARWWSHVAAIMIGLWCRLLWALFFGFVVSMKITCATTVYFLMRKAVDGTEMTEVFMEEQEEIEGGAPPEETGEEKKEGESAEGEESSAKKRASRKKKEEGTET
jgi:hypothetical protein